MSTHFYFWLILLFALQVGDVLITVAALRRDGREVNPVARAAMALLGPVAGLVALKVLVAVGVYVTWPSWPDADALLCLQVACAVYVVVVLHNARVLRGLMAREGAK